ncbi:MAG: DUF5693 family protein [Armatimonadetes bacterium]|nr:DUF5693 family protein [Armatimonadota bacterium]
MNRRTVLVLILIAGILASLFVAAQRVKVESRNKAVELVVDYGEIAQISATIGKPPAELLRSLKQSGATGVAITEETVRDAAEQYLLNQQILGEASSSHGIATMKNIARVPGLSLQYLEQLPLGLPKDAVINAKKAGMTIIARLLNYPGVTPEAIHKSLVDLKHLGINTIIFQGDQVLGFRGAVKETANSLVENDLIFGQVEFAKQKGETELAEYAQSNVIPVHSITQNEMPTLSESAIVERFKKAVRERGVRICYVRMYDTASADPVRVNCDYIRKIARGIIEAGYTFKKSHPIEEICSPASAKMLAGAGVGAGSLLLLMTLFEVSVPAGILWSVLTIGACAGLSGWGDMGRKIVALLAAVVFPTLAALWSVRGSPESPVESDRSIARAVGRLIGASAISVAGGILIVGLLSSRTFMLRIDQFMGIKVAHVAPILTLAAVFAGGIAWKSDTWQAQKRKIRESFGSLIGSPILMWQAIGLLVAMALIGLMVVRTGNEAGLEVSSIELKMRSILDRALVVRPRTKEFLIGYPLLLVGLVMAVRGRRRSASILVTLGSIGLASALNTFCHTHTPLVVTSLRTLNGLVIGLLIGLIAYWLLRKLPLEEKQDLPR